MTNVITSLTNLAFILQTYKDYIYNRSYLIEQSIHSSAFESVISIISIQDNTSVADQDYLLVSVDSKVFFTDVTLLNINISQTYLDLVQSETTLSNLKISNLTCSTDYSILTLLNSETVMSNITYSDSSCSFLRSTNSDVSISNATISSINADDYLLLFLNSVITIIENMYIGDVSSTLTSIMKSDKNVIHLIHNLTMINIQNTAFYLEDSTVTTIDNSTFSNCLRGISARESSFGTISNSTFENIGVSSNIYGSALYLLSSNATVQGSTFTNNSAYNGAGFFSSCSLANQCSTSLTNNTFDGNSALMKGGAVYYTMNRPTLDNNTFSHNTAEYGPDIGSYPVRIVEHGKATNKVTLGGVASGLDFDTPTIFDLVDYDNQVMNMEDSSIVKLTGKSANSSIFGTDYAKINSGIASFDVINFMASSGRQGVEYSVTTKAIDSAKAMLVAQNDEDYQQNYVTTLKVNFRNCKPGEYEDSKGQ